MTEEQFLKDGDWWLVTAKYPVACDALIQEVIESEDDPLKDFDYENELINECVDSFSYLDEFECDTDLVYEGITEDEQYDNWYDSQREGIEVYSVRIDKDIIDEYGLGWLNDKIV